MKESVLAVASGLFTAALFASPASAAPSIGDTVTCTGVGFTCSQASATVGSGVEFNSLFLGNPYLAEDFSANLLTISNVRGNAFGTGTQFSMSFTDPLNPFTSATFSGATGVTGFSQSKISLTGGVLTLDLNNIQFGAGSFLTVALGGNATAPVPEPAAWALMLLGFGGLGYTMRRRPQSGSRVRFA